jgi:hypothetical protein
MLEKKTGIIIVIVMAIIFLCLSKAFPLDRCVSLVQIVRVEHTKYFGIQFPYWYGVAQLKQESACREKVTAFDQGMGVAQFMPKTSQYIQSLMGEKLDPYNSKQAVRMQAFYMNRIHVKENWTKYLWLDYQIYNGGKGLLYKEYQRAGVDDWEAMRTQCKRNKIKMKWGVLDFCEVNYSYSKNIFKYSDPYRLGEDAFSYWCDTVSTETFETPFILEILKILSAASVISGM